MNDIKYAMQQIWHAHQEAGLGTWVEIQLWVFAILAVAWLIGWVGVGEKALVGLRGRLSYQRSAAGLAKLETSAPAAKPPTWLAGMPT